MLAIEKRLQLGSLNLDEPAMIGASGGRDSVALLDLLVGLGWRHLLVVHFDHGLREDSAGDALFVAELAAARGLAFVSERGDVRAAAARKRTSLETAARESRYEFFARVAHERQCARLFLAHHADDQVETFLFNLFRGSGASGLRGMRALSMRTVAGVDLEIVRPLLAVWRQEIDAYISEQGLVFREDASNAALEHTRNRLRKQVLPSLEAGFGRDVRQAVWRAAEILAAEEELIAALPPLTDARLAAKELPVVDLAQMPVAVQRRLLHRWMRAQGVTHVEFDDVEAVRGLLAGGRPAKVNLSGDCHARRRAGKLFIERKKPRP